MFNFSKFTLKSVLVVEIFIAGVLCASDSKFHSRVKVMVSNHEPFASFDEKQNVFKGLEVVIIENFGRKNNLSIEFIETKHDLLTVFSAADTFENFYKRTEHS